VKGGTSYLSACDNRLFFGLGSTAVVERVSVQWPAGSTQVLTDIPVDQFVTILEDPSGHRE